jgi:DNA (cytosine-5)-methyltransferase 1
MCFCNDDNDRVCNVAIELGADWRSLPDELSVTMRSARMERTSTHKDVRYSRVDANGHFRTALTTVNPNAQGSTVIHPTVRPFLVLLIYV